jgi:hypothetical protein
MSGLSGDAGIAAGGTDDGPPDPRNLSRIL